MNRAARIAAAATATLGLVVAGFVAINWAPDRPVARLAARWAPPPSAFIDVEGMRVHVRDEGRRDDPVPIVLLHGTSASLHTWDGWVRALESRHRVIRVDMPGFGLTGPSPVGDYAIRSQSVPLAFRVAKVPVLNRLMEVTLPRRLVEASVRNVYGDPGKVTPELVDRYYEITLREGNRAALVQRFVQAPLGIDEARIRGLRVPTLIIWGGRDRLIPVEYGEAFQRDIAESQLAVFDDLGHVPQEEDPARTVAAVETFLAGLPD